MVCYTNVNSMKRAFKKKYAITELVFLWWIILMKISVKHNFYAIISEKSVPMSIWATFSIDLCV